MIRIARSRAGNSLHKDFTGDRLVDKLMKLVEARIAQGDQIAFTGAIGDWKKAKPALKAETHGKCAYCEANTETVAHGDVEHFRPKSVYWWLALCVDNYTYSCQICNQSYKGDAFPVTGTRLQAPALPAQVPATAAARKALAKAICPDPAVATDPLLQSVWFKEDADLPNPYLDDPERLFAWKVAEVAQEVHLVPQDATARARRAVDAAVTHLGLNRETLTRSRFLAYKPLEFALTVWERGPRELAPAAEQQVRELCQDKCMFAGMSRFFARQRGFPL